MCYGTSVNSRVNRGGWQVVGEFAEGHVFDPIDKTSAGHLK